MLTDTTSSPYAKVSSIEYNDIELKEDSFWGEIFETIAKGTVPHLFKMFEDNSISHVVENLRIAARESEGHHEGTPFGDGDFYKCLEAAIYVNAKIKDASLEKKIDDYIELIAKAQQDDGYISTKQIIGERENNGVKRLSDIDDFEVYNLGHLFTTACIHYRITGKDSFLKIAIKGCDFLEVLYEEAKKNDEVKTAVCPSHYMGIIELYRVTKDDRFLKLAKLSLELRDSVKNGKDDNQDKTPLKKHEKIVGHAVRASYLYAGVSDFYAEEGDAEYFSMLEKVWRNLVDTKMYITGGCGALYNGASPYGNFWDHQLVHQAFGYEYQLPNITAYNETCASIGTVFWADRMFNISPKAEYFDVIEKIMLNTNLASINFEGDKFFYENMLRRAKELDFELCWPLTREEYILSFCCPPNIARVMAEVSEYFYKISENEIYTGLYGASTSKVTLKNNSFVINQETNYPYDGKIQFSFSNVENENEFYLNIRIPYWIESGYVSINGEKINIDKKESASYLKIKIENPSNAKIEVNFDMNVRYETANPLVEEVTNQIAVSKGPLVYCLEGVDVINNDLDGIMLSMDSVFEEQFLQIKNKKVLSLKTTAYRLKNNDEKNYLYKTFKYEGVENIDITMVPYFAWDNREYGEMKVWLPIILGKL